jgi:hypothetical protein
MSSLYTFSLFIQTLRQIRISSDQNIRWRLYLFFFSQIKENNLLSFPSTSWLIKKKGLGEKSHLKKKGLVRVCPGHGLTSQVGQVWPGFCTDRSFTLLELVQPPGRLVGPIV